MATQKLCNYPGCMQLVPLGVKYCDRHQKTVQAYRAKNLNSDGTYKQNARERHERAKKRYYERMYGEKEGKYQQFYKSKAWKQLARQFMEKNPVCQECLANGIIKKGDVVDHVIGIRKDWSRRLDESNLQSLCNHHHRIKTNKEMKERERKKLKEF